MKKYIFMALLGLSLSVPKAHAQWVVTDPGNFAGNIRQFSQGDSNCIEDSEEYP